MDFVVGAVIIVINALFDGLPAFRAGAAIIDSVQD